MKDHYLSQSYLKGFAEPGSRELWVCPFDERSWRPERPKDFAWEWDYYGEVDEALRTVENASARIIRRVRALQPISEDDRIGLCTFVTTMMGRVPALIDTLRAVVQSESDALLRSLYQRCREDPSQLERLTEEMTGAGLRPDSAMTIEDVDPSRVAFTAQSPGVALETLRAAATLFPALMAMTWRLLISSGRDFFITSDHPFYAIDRGASVRGMYGFAALGDPNVTATLPLGRHVALHLWKGPTGPVEYRPVDSAAVAELNFRTAWPAAKFIAGPSTTFPGSPDVMRRITEGRASFKPTADR